MQEILETVRQFFTNVNLLWVYFAISILGLYIYWKGCNETRKDRSSIFDTFTVSILFAFLIGRASYIVINWQEFNRYIWWWLPYEKYGENIELFRLLPWRFLRVWDGGLTIFVAMISFLLVLTLVVVLVKRWRWYQLFTPVYFSMISMLGISFLYSALLEGNMTWLYIGGVLFFVPLFYWILSKILLKSIKNGNKRRKVLVYIGVLVVTISSIVISYLYLSDVVYQLEMISAILLVIWTALMDVFVIIDVNKPNLTIESVSSVTGFDSIEINQPIRIKE